MGEDRWVFTIKNKKLPNHVAPMQGSRSIIITHKGGKPLQLVYESESLGSVMDTFDIQTPEGNCAPPKILATPLGQGRSLLAPFPLPPE